MNTANNNGVTFNAITKTYFIATNAQVVNVDTYLGVRLIKLDSSPEIGKIFNGEKIRVVNYGSYFSYVVYYINNNKGVKYGYVHSKYLALNKQFYDHYAPDGTVIDCNASDCYKPVSGNTYTVGQCTWYAWGRALQTTGVKLDVRGTPHGFAGEWLSTYISRGYMKYENKDFRMIQPLSVAVFTKGGGGCGHVLFIEDIDYNSDGSPKNVHFSESNWDGNAKYDKGTDGVVKAISFADFLSRSDKSLAGYIYLV